jgi:DNA replication protein DnaC
VGYVRLDVPEDDARFGKVQDCQCRRSQVETQRGEYLRRLGGLEHLGGRTFEAFNPEGIGLRDNDKANLRRAYERAREYAQNPQGWLVLTGGYGCGKTHLAAAIANEQITAGRKVFFITVPDLLDHLRSAYQPGEDSSEEDSFGDIRNIPVLVLDDMGIESPTPWAVEKLYQLLNYRYNARLATVITTNYSFEDIEARLRSRLSDPDVSEIMSISAPDYRLSGASTQSDLNGLSLYRHMTFDTFESRADLKKEEQDNLRMVIKATQAFASDPQGWLVLMGDYSSGKTHLSAAIANACAGRGMQSLFITVPDLLDHLRASFSPSSNSPYDKRFNEVKNAALLILDDLGTESATPWAREKLHQLFNHRYNAHLPTVITTSVELEKLDQRLVTRMFDQRLCRIFSILAPAYVGGTTRAKK